MAKHIFVVVEVYPPSHCVSKHFLGHVGMQSTLPLPRY